MNNQAAVSILDESKTLGEDESEDSKVTDTAGEIDSPQKLQPVKQKIKLHKDDDNDVDPDNPLGQSN